MTTTVDMETQIKQLEALAWMDNASAREAAEEIFTPYVNIEIRMTGEGGRCDLELTREDGAPVDVYEEALVAAALTAYGFRPMAHVGWGSPRGGRRYTEAPVFDPTGLDFLGDRLALKGRFVLRHEDGEPWRD